jgi:hypothetical protein
VLEVVEHEQGAAAGDRRREIVERAGALLAQRGRDRVREAARVRAREIGEARVAGARGDLARQARLARAAGAGHRDKPRRVGERRQLAHLAFPADEARQLGHARTLT